MVHPGAMGAGVGGALVQAGHEVLWCRAGRSEATAARADAAGMRAVESLAELAAACSTVISLCPPAFASDVAAAAADAGFTGTYVDANAISPARVRSLPVGSGAVSGSATGAASGEVELVDGSVIGPPPSHDRPG